MHIAIIENGNIGSGLASVLSKADHAATVHGREAEITPQWLAA